MKTERLKAKLEKNARLYEENAEKMRVAMGTDMELIRRERELNRKDIDLRRELGRPTYAFLKKIRVPPGKRGVKKGIHRGPYHRREGNEL